ncbi:MAG: UDP-N-acetylglucosamine 2-epimerase (non-hydrolyzing), partial [Chloroflexota bacterium]
GQHYSENMSRLFFNELDLPEPNINLEIGSGSHAEQTSGMLLGIDRYLEETQPDWMIVYGDTNSTLAGALAAAKREIPIAHVEAGLRSFNRSMPEEINRLVSDHLSALLFCPTDQAVQNLKKEGISNGVHQVGDVMADSLLLFCKIAEKKSTILQTLKLEPGKYALVTVHRSGNTDDKHNLVQIMDGLARIQFDLVFPMHPRTQKMMTEFGLKIPANLCVIDPVGYLDMLMLESSADCILTDSGGIQKEAYLLGVRCITLREETEWVETVAAGWNCLTGAHSEKIKARFDDFHPENERPPIYGDGHAADKIIEILTQN